jgi:hypothetical protein
VDAVVSSQRIGNDFFSGACKIDGIRRFTISAKHCGSQRIAGSN